MVPNEVVEKRCATSTLLRENRACPRGHFIKTPRRWILVTSVQHSRLMEVSFTLENQHTTILDFFQQ